MYHSAEVMPLTGKYVILLCWILSLYFPSTHSLSSSALITTAGHFSARLTACVCVCIPPLNGEFVKSVKLKSSFVSLACGRFNPERPGLSRHTHKHAYTHFYRPSLSFARQIPNSVRGWYDMLKLMRLILSAWLHLTVWYSNLCLSFFHKLFIHLQMIVLFSVILVSLLYH